MVGKKNTPVKPPVKQTVRAAPAAKVVQVPGRVTPQVVRGVGNPGNVVVMNQQPNVVYVQDPYAPLVVGAVLANSIVDVGYGPVYVDAGYGYGDYYYGGKKKQGAAKQTAKQTAKQGAAKQPSVAAPKPKAKK
jgi:hypothetical protein